MDFAADLPFFYAEFGVLARHTPKSGGASKDALVLFDQPGVNIVQGEILATDLGIRFRTASFPVVRKDDAFLIKGQSYLARENAQPTEDGDEQTVPLKKA